MCTSGQILREYLAIHDANLVATMLVHGVDTVVTMNLEDFAGFAGQVRLIRL